MAIHGQAGDVPPAAATGRDVRSSSCAAVFAQIVNCACDLADTVASIRRTQFAGRDSGSRHRWTLDPSDLNHTPRNGLASNIDLAALDAKPDVARCRTAELRGWDKLGKQQAVLKLTLERGILFE